MCIAKYIFKCTGMPFYLIHVWTRFKMTHFDRNVHCGAVVGHKMKWKDFFFSFLTFSSLRHKMHLYVERQKYQRFNIIWNVCWFLCRAVNIVWNVCDAFLQIMWATLTKIHVALCWTDVVYQKIEWQLYGHGKKVHSLSILGIYVLAYNTYFLWHIRSYLIL